MFVFLTKDVLDYNALHIIYCSLLLPVFFLLCGTVGRDPQNNKSNSYVTKKAIVSQVRYDETGLN